MKQNYSCANYEWKQERIIAAFYKNKKAWILRSRLTCISEVNLIRSRSERSVSTLE